MDSKIRVSSEVPIYYDPANPGEFLLTSEIQDQAAIDFLASVIACGLFALLFWTLGLLKLASYICEDPDA